MLNGWLVGWQLSNHRSEPSCCCEVISDLDLFIQVWVFSISLKFLLVEWWSMLLFLRASIHSSSSSAFSGSDNRFRYSHQFTMKFFLLTDAYDFEWFRSSSASSQSFINFLSFVLINNDYRRQDTHSLSAMCRSITLLYVKYSNVMKKTSRLHLFQFFKSNLIFLAPIIHVMTLTS